jgi:hypothetical protein
MITTSIETACPFLFTFFRDLSFFPIVYVSTGNTVRIEDILADEPG